MSEKKSCGSCGRPIEGTPLEVPTTSNDVASYFHASPSECANARPASRIFAGNVDKRKRQAEFQRDTMGWKYE